MLFEFEAKTGRYDVKPDDLIVNGVQCTSFLVGEGEIIDLEQLPQRPGNPEQNFWKISLKNGPGVVDVITATRRDRQVTLQTKRDFQRGTYMAYVAVPINGTLKLQKLLKLKTKPKQATFNLTNTSLAIQRAAGM